MAGGNPAICHTFCAPSLFFIRCSLYFLTGFHEILTSSNQLKNKSQLNFKRPCVRPTCLHGVDFFHSETFNVQAVTPSRPFGPFSGRVGRNPQRARRQIDNFAFIG